MAMDIGAKQTKKGRATPEMNVTPLVDVVLVLLIIFMVVTPLLMKQFWIALPLDQQAATPPPTPGNAPIVVSVNAHGDALINRDVVPTSELQARLRRVLAARHERTVFFDAADDAPFERAVEVLDLARGGGAVTIAVATERIAR